MTRQATRHARECADRLLRWLGEHDMSALRFAQMARVSESTIYTFLGGKGMMSVESLTRICKRHKISADWLLGLKEGEQ